MLTRRRSSEQGDSEPITRRYAENDKKTSVEVMAVFDPLKINLDSERQRQKEKEAEMLKKQIEETRKLNRELRRRS